MLDADLARLYGVSTKRLNEQVKRNKERFPERFMFRLTANEKAEVVANCDHLQKLKFSPVLPYAFTEHGAIMAATVLNTSRAIQVSIYVVEAFDCGNCFHPIENWPKSSRSWNAAWPSTTTTFGPSLKPFANYLTLSNRPVGRSVFTSKRAMLDTA